MRGGSYLVVRRIRIALEHWDRMKIAFQEQTIGRRKYSGAPLGAEKEFDPIDLDAKDARTAIRSFPKIRMSGSPHQASIEGSRILRRPYSYNDGANFTAERWPPWRQGMEFDAGLVLHLLSARPAQRLHQDFRENVALRHDEPIRHQCGGGHFVCPGGAAEGEFIGQRLFETAS